MSLSRGGLYGLLAGGVFLGYIWLFCSLAFNGAPGDASVEVCLVRNICRIPCPSCGSTRAIMALLNGHFLESLFINPLGMILFAIMVFAPVWILYDHFGKKQTLYDAYKRLEAWMQKPLLAMPFILLVLLNWFWNISKGL